MAPLWGVAGLPAGLEPQEQRDEAVEGREFSVEERSQVQAPAGRAPAGSISIEWRSERIDDVRHEQRGPETVFSVEALSHEHAKAAFCPQEHLACEAVKF